VFHATRRGEGRIYIEFNRKLDSEEMAVNRMLKNAGNGRVAQPFGSGGAQLPERPLLQGVRARACGLNSATLSATPKTGEARDGSMGGDLPPRIPAPLFRYAGCRARPASPRSGLWRRNPAERRQPPRPGARRPRAPRGYPCPGARAHWRCLPTQGLLNGPDGGRDPRPRPRLWLLSPHRLHRSRGRCPGPGSRGDVEREDRATLRGRVPPRRPGPDPGGGLSACVPPKAATPASRPVDPRNLAPWESPRLCRSSISNAVLSRLTLSCQCDVTEALFA